MWKVEVGGIKPSCMRRLALLLAALLVLLPLNVQAGTPIAVDEGAVFGSHGGAVTTGNTSAVGLDDLDPVLEDYTATWCTNCVDVEHALDDLVAERGGSIFSFHRSIGETEDRRTGRAMGATVRPQGATYGGFQRHDDGHWKRG